MTQNVCVSVQMDEKGFHDFASFDLLRHNKGWQRPAVFTAILLVCAGICLSQIGKREGAGLLTAVLAIVAIGLPAVYFGTFFANRQMCIRDSLQADQKAGSAPSLLPAGTGRRRAFGLDGR